MKQDPATIWSSIIGTKEIIWQIPSTKPVIKRTKAELHPKQKNKNKKKNQSPPHGGKHNYTSIILRHVAVMLTFPGHCPANSLTSLYQTRATKLPNYTIMAWCTCACKWWYFLPSVSNELPKGSLKVKISMLLSQKNHLQNGTFI